VRPDGRHRLHTPGESLAAVVPVAKRAGARVVIPNADPTEMDHLADASPRGGIREIPPRRVADS
jgi:hypothetical protein